MHSIVGKDAPSVEVGRPSKEDNIQTLLLRIAKINTRQISLTLTIQIIVLIVAGSILLWGFVKNNKRYIFFIVFFVIVTATIYFFDFHAERYRRIYSRECALRALKKLGTQAKKLPSVHIAPRIDAYDRMYR